MNQQGKRYPLLASTLLHSTLGGWRLTCYGPDREPLVSLWGEQPMQLHREADRLLEVQPKPADGVLAVTYWRTRRAAA